jgi:hypothetical protein
MGSQLLINIRRSTKNITSKQVADLARVSLATVYVTEIGGRVHRLDAEKVLDAFSQLAGQRYTFNNVRVDIIQAS